MKHYNNPIMALALCAMAELANAETWESRGNCSLSSIIPGSGKCALSAIVIPDFPFPIITKSYVKVGSIIVNRGFNDSINRSDTASFLNVGVEVPCGKSHQVRFYIMRPSASTFEEVGALPPVYCSAAP